MDCILSEVVEMLKKEMEMTENLMKMAEEQKGLYKNRFNTNDKFEAATHEYWRGRVTGLKDKKNTFRRILDDIYDMIGEESCTQEAYEDHIRDLKGDAHGRL